MKFVLIMSLMAISLASQAQDQLALRFNHSGVLALMKAALKYNNRAQNSAGFQIPQGLYSFKIKKAQLASNPIIQLVSEVSDVSLLRDFPFYVYNSTIKASGDVDVNSLRVTALNQSARGFDLKVSFNVPQLRMAVPEIALCETKAGGRCGKGLKASFKNSSITLVKGRPIVLTGLFRVDVKDQKARLRLLSATSNLETRGGPRIDIRAGELSIPPVIVTVNGESAELDTSSLRSELLKHKDFLGKKLLGFAADFIAEDMVAIVNRTLQNECLPSQLNVVNLEPRPVAGMPLIFGLTQKQDFGTLLQRDVSRIIKSARLDLGLKSVATDQNKHINLGANGSLRLNGKSWTMTNRLGNSNRTLPALNIAQHINETINFGVALSEPIVNSSLDLLGQTGLFQELVNKHVDSKGLSVSSARIHFRSNPDRFYAVVNASLDLREVNSNGVFSWIKNRFAIWMERNNNGSKLYFPLQFEIIPRMVHANDGSAHMLLRVNGPFLPASALRNDFKYPTNITTATASVREGVVKELKEGLLKYVNQEFHFQVDPYLNQKGMSFNVRGMKIVDSAYVVLGLDLKAINLGSLTSSDRGSCR